MAGRSVAIERMYEKKEKKKTSIEKDLHGANAINIEIPIKGKNPRAPAYGSPSFTSWSPSVNAFSASSGTCLFGLQERKVPVNQAIN